NRSFMPSLRGLPVQTYSNGIVAYRPALVVSIVPLLAHSPPAFRLCCAPLPGEESTGTASWETRAGVPTRVILLASTPARSLIHAAAQVPAPTKLSFVVASKNSFFLPPSSSRT